MLLMKHRSIQHRSVPWGFRGGTPQGARSVTMSEKVLFMVAGPMAVVLAIAAPVISSF
jgi:hypothetical protein